jgi:hypothetical protein
LWQCIKPAVIQLFPGVATNLRESLPDLCHIPAMSQSLLTDPAIIRPALVAPQATMTPVPVAQRPARGILVALGLSALCWAGIGLLLAQIW